jgi:hypothetical protein
VTTTGDTRWWVKAKHQELGPLFYERSAIAVRDALNRLTAPGSPAQEGT